MRSIVFECKEILRFTSDGSAKCGHLPEAHVFLTLELIVTVAPQAMKKTLYPGAGLALIDPKS